MRLEKLEIKSSFKNINKLLLSFSDTKGVTVLIGNNGSGKSNILEAISDIFAGLYNGSISSTFDYYLEYSIDGHKVEVAYKDKKELFRVDNKVVNISNNYLPSRLIACYSGEESRLWETYFEPFYKNYIKGLRGQIAPLNNSLIFINKYYWNIALLTFYFHDFERFTDLRDFCQNDIGIRNVNGISFKFSIAKLKTWEDNPVITNFVETLNPDNKKTITISIEELRKRLSNFTVGQFFDYLTAAHMPKNNKLITHVTFNYNDKLTGESFSEGEKKLILLRLILDVISDEKSLILMDEPDSHIHISRKNDIQKILWEKPLKEDAHPREIILTTHSPTLTHCFEPQHIIMLERDENGYAKTIDKDKQEIVHQLTDGVWSYQEQNIFLSSNKDVLLVEGKFDKIYISEALKRLKPKHKEYEALDFEYFPMGGAEGLENFINKFTPKEGQKIIAVLDRDDAGKKPIEAILDNEIDLKTFKYDKKKDVYLMLYPTTEGWGVSSFLVEDYFKKSTLKEFFKDFIYEKIDNDSFKEIPKDIKTQLKRKLPDICQQKNKFADSEFDGFKVLFDKIIEIKKDK